MELKWLEDFVCLAQHRSYSRAAGDRNITQSALSKRIKQLESWVGLPLVDRSSNPISLTKAGESFLPRAQDALEMLLSARKTVSDRYSATWQVLSFATLNTLSLTFFPHWMAEIEAPGNSFRARFADPHSSFVGNISTLVSGHCDFFLTYAHPAVPQMEDLDGYPFLALGTERVIPVSAPDPAGQALHSLRDRSLPTDFLSYRGNSFFSLALPWLFEKHGFRLNTVYENGMSVALKAMAVSGHGVAWIPESLVEDEMRRGVLVRGGDRDTDLLTEIRVYRTPQFRNKQAERFWRRASQLVSQKGAQTDRPPAKDDPTPFQER